ncbi:OprO/OprP family phosphate-selective porin [Myxococcota bacterium]|nr:OprO/OprP family phosphate-selective porin [Myxococcota bacterium]
MSTVLLFPLLLSWAAQAEDAPLKLGLSFQPRLSATLDGSPDQSDQAAVTDAGLRVRRMLVTANGTVAQRIDYRFRANLANAFSFTDGDGKAQQGSKPVLDDAQVVFRVVDAFQISAGQWKVPFTVSQAMGDTSLLLPDRPIVLDGFKAGDLEVDGFTWSRDAGVAVLGQVSGKRLEYAIGAFNGDGQNTWPPTDEAPLVAGRPGARPALVAPGPLDGDRGRRHQPGRGRGQLVPARPRQGGRPPRPQGPAPAALGHDPAGGAGPPGGAPGPARGRRGDLIARP